jgi:putative mRNA 3-end processing factor
VNDLVVLSPQGLYCPPGDFYIDPWRPVTRAVITHAHADHARVGHASYVASAEGEHVLRARLGDITLQTLRWSECLTMKGVKISLHPAGHVLGSAQVRLEYAGQVWVVSGDYKTEPDRSCTAFEPVRCDTFITESTFGLPIYRWAPAQVVIAELVHWWQDNAADKRASVLFCYSLGKAQRILAALGALGSHLPGDIVCHSAVETLNRAYRASGIALPPTRSGELDRSSLGSALVVAPPSVEGSAWLRAAGDASTAFASGWMRVRGARRRRAVERGFVLSDHADWPGLQHAIRASGASRVIVTHGQQAPMVRWLNEQGLQAGSFQTHFSDDGEPAASATETGPESLGESSTQQRVDGVQ